MSRKVWKRREVLHAEIHQRQLVKMELESSQEQVRLTFHSASVAIAMISIEGRFLLVNQTFCDIVGYSEEELKGLYCHNLDYGQDNLEARKNRQRLLDGKIDSSVVEKRYRMKSGQPIWVRISSPLVKSPDGSPCNLINM